MRARNLTLLPLKCGLPARSNAGGLFYFEANNPQGTRNDMMTQCTRMDTREVVWVYQSLVRDLFLFGDSGFGQMVVIYG